MSTVNEVNKKNENLWLVSMPQLHTAAMAEFMSLRRWTVLILGFT
ncbi:uncharacterized protein G6M90_00g045680 [Metarhizium brunneum]|uniref:Uncharacterized protein n=1 Tax=Metarhizium brunneum TaxID=500148 RepID=A0A7D5Z037_9HYPO|nr:hypothetical protein G6M90_00g045680 [Metarhizium brunneum]